jgi:hypothetical protein
MAEYARVLAEAAVADERYSNAHSLTYRPGMPFGTAQTAFFGPLVRLLCGGHVRERLSRLADRYSQLELSLDPPPDTEEREWLQRTIEHAREVAGSLPKMRLPAILTLLPVVFAAIGVAGKLSFDDMPSSIWIVAGLVAGFLALVVYGDLRRAYRWKREIFMPGATRIDRLSREEQRGHTGANLYRDEQALFAATGAYRKSEAALDEGADALATFVLVAAGGFLPSLVWGEVGFVIGLVVALGICMVLMVQGRRHRVWL